MIDISQTILAKSDQLNADDLIGSSLTITVANVNVNSSPDQPVTINYNGDNGRPYKPCLSMRKVLAGLWGVDASIWIGRSMTLFMDPSVRWAGKDVGGIRISAVSNIDSAKDISMNQSKNKKTTYRIDPIKTESKPQYPAAKFEGALSAMQGMIDKGSTPAKIIAQCEKTGLLTNEQKLKIETMALKEEDM